LTKATPVYLEAISLKAGSMKRQGPHTLAMSAEADTAHVDAAGGSRGDRD
jgi:hypothetical protein